jgi:hypothetical protein
MGTNYYWHDKPCEHCGRYEEIHVGKSGGHWRGYRHKLMDDAHPEWGYEQRSPFGFPVLSIDDWAKVFAERPGRLFDEYGIEYTDPSLWLSEFLPPKGELRDQLDRYFRDGDNWYDPEGFHFSGYEFS